MTAKSLQADAIYVTYDGLLEPLGYAQVLAYLVPLSEQGVRLEIVSFEKPTDLQDGRRLEYLERELEQRGIVWTRLRYHRRPRLLSTIADLLVGAFTIIRRVRANGAYLIHARSYVPAAMALPVALLSGRKLLFDMRGFWPEERVELGVFSSASLLYRCSKTLERILLRCADRIVVLTEKSKNILLASNSPQVDPEDVHVIPCCVAPERFGVPDDNSALRDQYELTGKLVVGNIGAVSTLYYVPQLFRFCFYLTRLLSRVQFVYLTLQDPTQLHRIAAQQGLDPNEVLVTKASPQDVPRWLSLFELGIFFPKPCYATQAMCPTKLGEFLAAGVPVVTSSGVGDVDDILKGEQVGILLRDFSDPALKAAATEAAKWLPVSKDLRERCRRLAIEQFDLTKGFSRYLTIYQDLKQTSSTEVRYDNVQEGP